MKLCRLSPIMLLLSVPAGAQQSTPLTAELRPGEIVNYEYDGDFDFVPQKQTNQFLVHNMPKECSYHVHAVLQVRVESGTGAAARRGSVQFRDVQMSGWNCPEGARKRTVAELKDLGSQPAPFEIMPDGEVRLKRAELKQYEAGGIAQLLRAAWDILQTRISHDPIAPAAPRASKQFVYWPDTFEDGLKLAVSSISYEGDVTVGGRRCALVRFKQVLAPDELPAYVDERTRAAGFDGVHVIAGSYQVSLLLDRSAQQIVYLKRDREIDNRLVMRYDDPIEVPVARFSLKEHSTLRLVPERGLDAWLAALHAFEQARSPAPAPATGAIPAAPAEEAGGGTLAAAAAASRRSQQARRSEVLTTLDRAPAGFKRWVRTFCEGDFCYDVSVSVPNSAEVASGDQHTALQLAPVAGETATIAVGPAIDCPYGGLNAKEQLRRRAAQYLANQLWFAGSPGKALLTEETELDDRTAEIVDFEASGRDLSPLRGSLSFVMGPYSEIVSVACAFKAERVRLADVCRTVAESVKIHFAQDGPDCDCNDGYGDDDP